MNDQSASLGGPVISPESLRCSLYDFLSLEAPYLRAGMPHTESAGELQDWLLGRVEEVWGGGELEDRSVYPVLTREQAAGQARQRLEEAIRGFFARRAIADSITPDEQRLMLRSMLLTRALDNHLKAAFDEKSVAWNGYPSPQKGFRSTGQEAIVGAALRLRRPPEFAPGPDYRGDYISPMIRDLGALLMFMPGALHPILVQYGKRGAVSGGRDFHVGDMTQGVVPAAASLATAAQTLVGMAYAFKLRREDRVCLTFIGDGGVSLGEWHEAANFAAALKLNVVFIVENNQWALGTHVSEQTAVRRFSEKAAGYGMPGVSVFGNDPDQIASAVTWAAERAREGRGPALIELVTYRRSGHAHHDDDRFHGNPKVGIVGYEDPEEGALWEAFDPLRLYEERLVRSGAVSEERLEQMRRAVELEVEAAVEVAVSAPWPEPGDYRDRVYAPGRSDGKPADPEVVQTRAMAYDEAVRDALAEMMEADERVVVLGEDVGGRYGGVFGVTRGLAKRFGAERCLNTPLAESAIVGCAVGAALMGMRPVAEMQFADFLAPAFNALVNNAAKIYWRWGRPVPMVLRLPYGAATGSKDRLLGGGPFHSQCPEMWFVRTPGWKIVAPSTPADAKGLLIASIQDENPVLFLEAKGLYGFHRTDLREEVPLGCEVEVPIGVAAVRREGVDVTILTYGAMVWTVLIAAEELARDGVSVEVVDLRTLQPLDEATIERSVAKTNRVLIVHEDTRSGGIGGELAAIIADRLFYLLDAPIRRVTAPDTPVPYSPPLELDFLPQTEEIVREVRRLVQG